MGIFAGILAVVLNQAFCVLLLNTEKELAAKGKIPKRGMILYLEDYLFFRRGDKLFLSIMDFAIAFVLVERWPLSTWVVVLCLAGGVAWTALWHVRWLRRHKAFDSAYPRPRTVSLLGRIHLGYYWAQYTLGVLGLSMVVLMATGARTWSFMVVPGLFAAILYYVMLYADVRAGRAP